MSGALLRRHQSPSSLFPPRSMPPCKRGGEDGGRREGGGKERATGVEEGVEGGKRGKEGATGERREKKGERGKHIVRVLIENSGERGMVHNASSIPT